MEKTAITRSLSHTRLNSLASRKTYICFAWVMGGGGKRTLTDPQNQSPPYLSLGVRAGRMTAIKTLFLLLGKEEDKKLVFAAQAWAGVPNDGRDPIAPERGRVSTRSN